MFLNGFMWYVFVLLFINSIALLLTAFQGELHLDEFLSDVGDVSIAMLVGIWPAIIIVAALKLLAFIFRIPFEFVTTPISELSEKYKLPKIKIVKE